jgi:hypothetical protein
MRGRTRQIGLPWSGSTPAAAQSSYDGAILAERTAEGDCRRLLEFLRARRHFGATDAEVEKALKWPPNKSTARRNDLVERGLVVQPVPYARARRLSVKSSVHVSVWIASDFGRP